MNHALHLIVPDEDGPGAGPEPVTVTLEEGLAAAALAAGDFSALLHHCSAIVQQTPEHFQAWFNLGYARHKTGEAEEAEFAYRQAHRLAPDKAEPLLNLGILKQAHDAGQAALLYEHVLELAPFSGPALWNLSLILERRGDRDRAVELCRRLLESMPDQEELWFRVGVLEMDRGQFESARLCFEESLRYQPEWAEAQLNHALACWRLGLSGQARQGLERAVELKPQLAQGWMALAALACENGELAKGLAARQRMCDLGEKKPELTFNLALALERQGKLEEAKQLYCEAVMERPTFAAPLVNLGHMLESDGMRDQALECWSRAFNREVETA
jgi:protein O-GlcNAc transferase